MSFKLSIWGAKSLRIGLGVVTMSIVCCDITRGHEVGVHNELSRSAFFLSKGLMRFVDDSIPPTQGTYIVVHSKPLSGALVGVFGYEFLSLTPVDWLGQGSIDEDSRGNFLDHFYTIRLGTISGLTDSSEDPLSWIVRGRITDSFTWGTDGGILHPVLQVGLTQNRQTWAWARTWEFQALTSSARSDRDSRLAATLFALGHVIHLNQDTSSPDHTRNDEHANPVRKIWEPYGIKVFMDRPQWFALKPNAKLGRQAWKDAGFNKIEDFWNKKKYMSVSSSAVP